MGMARAGHPHAFHDDRAHGSMPSASAGRCWCGRETGGLRAVVSKSARTTRCRSPLPRHRSTTALPPPQRAKGMASRFWPGETGSTRRPRLLENVGAALPLRRPRARSKERRRSGARPVAVPLPTPPPRIEGASDASNAKISADGLVQTRPGRGPRQVGCKRLTKDYQRRWGRRANRVR